MNYIQALILSLAEGLTEFLPISSTGHLILVSYILRVPQTEFVKSFEIFIQLGSISAVTVLYFKWLFVHRESWIKVVVAFIPTAFVGLFLFKFIKSYLLGNLFVTLFFLLIGGIVLLIFEKLIPSKAVTKTQMSELTLMDSLLIGVGQSLSVIPGISRAAATIVSAMLVGATREMAVEFSFILAIPTMFAASGLDLIKSGTSFTNNEFMLLVIGFLGSFVFALLAVKLFLNYVKKHDFVAFGLYRIILALIFLACMLKH